MHGSHRTHTNRDTHPSNVLILRFSVARGRKAPCATRAGGPLRRLGRRPLALAKHALARARRRLRLDGRLVVDRRRLGVRVDGGARLLGQLLEERLGELVLLVHLRPVLGDRRRLDLDLALEGGDLGLGAAVSALEEAGDEATAEEAPVEEVGEEAMVEEAAPPPPELWRRRGTGLIGMSRARISSSVTAVLVPLASRMLSLAALMKGTQAAALMVISAMCAGVHNTTGLRAARQRGPAGRGLVVGVGLALAVVPLGAEVERPDIRVHARHELEVRLARVLGARERVGAVVAGQADLRDRRGLRRVHVDHPHALRWCGGAGRRRRAAEVVGVLRPVQVRV